MDSKNFNMEEKLHRAEDHMRIDSVVQEFYFSDSAEEVIGGKWVTSYDAADFKDGKYLWLRSTATFSDGSTRESYPERIGKCDDLREQIVPEEEHEMTATELLIWFAETDTQTVKDIFDGAYYFDDIVCCDFTPDEIIDRITEYETKKKEKPVEIEKGYTCSVYDEDDDYEGYTLWGVTEEAAKDDVIDKAIMRTRKTGKLMHTNVCFTCRVKEANHDNN